MKTLKQKYEDSQKNSLRTQYELREKLKLVESKLLLNEKLDDKAIKKIGDVLTRLRAIASAFQNEYLNNCVNQINKDLNLVLKAGGTGKWLKNKMGFADNVKRALGAADALENGFSQLPFLVKNALQADLAELVATGATKRAAASEEDATVKADKIAETDPTLLAISNAAQEKKEIQTKKFKATIAKAFQPSKDWQSVFKIGSALQYSYFKSSLLASEVLKTKVSVLLKTIEVATNAKNQTKSEDANIAQALEKETSANGQKKAETTSSVTNVDQLAKDLNLNDADKFKVQKWYDFFKDKGLIK